MQGRSDNFKPTGEDPEATLVTPRFDAEEARRAHPVVPLVEVPPRSPYAYASRRARVRGPRRSWVPALLAVGLLAIAALGGALVTQVMLSPRAERAQEQTQAAPVEAAPAQAAEAPPPQRSAPVAAEAPREDPPAVGPTPRRERARRAIAATTPAAAGSVREVAEEDEDEAEERRERREERRREREEEIEKQMRKAAKRAKEQAKGKAPRLVDVYTPSP